MHTLISLPHNLSSTQIRDLRVGCPSDRYRGLDSPDSYSLFMQGQKFLGIS